MTTGEKREIDREAQHLAERVDATYDAIAAKGYTPTFAMEVVAGLAAGGYFTENPINVEVHQ